jgi:hypothetical protein
VPAVVLDRETRRVAGLAGAGEQDQAGGTVAVRAEGFEQFEHAGVVCIALAGKGIADVLGQVEIAD